MLKGKVALVTGSTSGIGLAIADKLAKNGANIVINGFGEVSAIENERLGLEKKYGIKCFYHGADLSKPTEIEKMMDFVANSLGGVDILVNNAGIQFVSPIDKFPVEKWDQIIALNLSASFHTIRLAVPYMRSKNWGRLINIASTHGLVASANKSAYVAAKHGIVGLCKSVALELAETFVTCNAICPGFVLTPLVQKQIDDIVKTGKSLETATKDFLGEKHPSLRFVEPGHVADLALFLCSEAGSSITGSAYTIDGGWVAR